ncbi:MAG TPA: hypothetical protein VH186_36745 [Chloroflexia bacterium]|nr:hypothetical protein [Chloroflexia bacterium]
MRKIIILLVFVAFGFLTVKPTLAADMPMCEHQTTIASLQECVMHAYQMGHIDNKGIANSLNSKLAAAQAALDRGQTEVARNLLNAFINQVQAQAGKHIVAEHAQHLIMHAQLVLGALP